MAALPSGPYTVKIELAGFKTLQNRGMQLRAGQTVRQTFALQVGALAETVTVAGETPLIETSASLLQADSLGTQEVRELPVNRRNLTNLMSLTPGVSTSGAGDVQMNGVAAGGTGVTVDGTEANSNPEARSLAQYGGQNQISVMSLDAVAEVQIVKGVLSAEYGGVVGGQVDVISRSGTNTFHGSAFYSGQNEKYNARNFFSSAQQPVGTFHQYGGTLGGPILRSRVFFFATYEGYRENVQLNLNQVVPYRDVRDEILRALPFPGTSTVLEARPLPTEPIVSSQGVVDPRVGRWRGLGTRRRTAATTWTAARRCSTTGCRPPFASISKTATPGRSTTRSARATPHRVATCRRTTSRPSRTTRTSGIPSSIGGPPATTSVIV